VTVQENHNYDFQTGPSNYLHDTAGIVIENNTNGSNITLDRTQGIQIDGADVLNDHGLKTTIPDSAGAAVTFSKYFTNAGGKWALQNSTTTFTGYYNNAGTATALTAGYFAIYRLYICKQSLNATTPTYIAVLHTAQFATLNAARAIVTAGTAASPTNELNALEPCQLGFIIYRQSTATIVQAAIAKSTLRSGTSSGGTNVASLVTTSVTNFDRWLTAADTNVQAALETLDDVGLNVTPQYGILYAGASYALSATAALTNGQLIIGQTGGAPTPATLTAGAGISITNAAGAVTVAVTGSGMAWEEVTDATKAMAIATAYGANRGGGVTFTLPATAAAGSVMEIVGIAGLWVLAQNAGQTVYLGSTNTTAGIGGSLTATNAGDCITLRCITANTAFRVTAWVGNITTA
jgi:hypothetical protein